MAEHKDNPFQDPNFTPVEYDPQYILQVNHLKKYFPIKSGMIAHTVGYVKAVDGVTFNLKRGTTMGLVGESGCGKTTLLRLLAGLSAPDAGRVLRRPGLRLGYLPQYRSIDRQFPVTVLEVVRSGLANQKSLFRRFSREADRQAMDTLSTLGLDHLATRPIDSLSGGEQARLALLKLFLQGPNFLILDEPTNHLDIPTREVLEQALLDFGGTYLVVSHDRYFLDKITQRTLVLEHKQLTEYVGNYSYYREKVREAQEAAEKAAAEAQGSSQAQEKAVAPAVKKAEPAPAVKAPAKAPAYGQAAKLEKIEMKIAELEATIKMYEVQMNMPQNQTDADAMMELTKEYEVAQAQLDEAYEKWEALAES